MIRLLIRLTRSHQLELANSEVTELVSVEILSSQRVEHRVQTRLHMKAGRSHHVFGKIDHRQVTRLGYKYQDLICIRVLIEWYKDPKRYKWISIEADSAIGPVRSLDDVVCYRPDGQYEVYQVKFTIDSTREDLHLDFDWLLKKNSERSKSLIEKWATGIQNLNAKDKIAVAKLVTNRIPDDEFSACLADCKINYDLIPTEFKLKIDSQLGGEEAARAFLEIFTFQHSQEEIDELELKLRDSLVPDYTDSYGWQQLLDNVKIWASRIDSPSPDGKIYLKHIESILHPQLKNVISQAFDVPDGYIPPTEEFHDEVMAKISAPGCHIITGFPGMGKSTYLSYLTRLLLENRIPVLRHHYNLGAQGFDDRIAYNSAAKSLLKQVKDLFPDDFDIDVGESIQLEVVLERAADLAAEKQTMLVIVVDGLDHVYREKQDIGQLEALINRIMPLKDKVSLIFGTQPVGNESLPHSLLQAAPNREAWIAISPMGLEAIRSHLKSLVVTGSIEIAGGSSHLDANLVRIIDQLQHVSNGYPLYFVYTLKSLTSKQQPINEYDIQGVPLPPGGDIEGYYKSLWVSLSPSAKKILLLIANADFYWPSKDHLGRCFNNSLDFEDSFGKIKHLVEQRYSGLVPIHNSLIAYLRNQKKFIEEKDALNRLSRDWLTTDAPSYWRWGWEWIVEANLGNTTMILEGITRAWMVQSLSKGYPPEHIEHILNTAEQIAFDEGKYSKLLRIRHLKTRMLNGIESQSEQQFSKFIDSALQITEEPFGILWRADNLVTLSGEQLVIVAKHSEKLDTKIATECANEIYRRIKFYVKSDTRETRERLVRLVNNYIDILTQSDNPELNSIHDFLHRFEDPSSILDKVVEQLIYHGNRYKVLHLHSLNILDSASPLARNEIALATIIEGTHLRENYQVLEKSEIYSVHQFLKGKDIQALPFPAEPLEVTAQDLHHYFFSALQQNLATDVVAEDRGLTNYADSQDFLTNTLSALWSAASGLAKDLKNGKYFQIPDFYAYVTELLRAEVYEHRYIATTMNKSAESAFAKIAIDLNIITGSVERLKNLDTPSLARLSQNAWWNMEVFLEVSSNNHIRNLCRETIEREFDNLLSEEVKRRLNIGTLTERSIKLANLALNHGCNNAAQSFLERAALNIVGYGYRKDLSLHEIFESIEHFSELNYVRIPAWLERLSTFTYDVFDYSEKEIRHIPGWFIQLLGKHDPARLVDEFDYLLKQDDWDRGDLVVESLVLNLPLIDELEHAWLRCLTTYKAIMALQKRSVNNPSLKKTYKDQVKALGGVPPRPREDRGTTLQSHEEETALPCISDVRPSDLKGLSALIKSARYDSVKRIIGQWINYWTDLGQGHAILAAFQTYYDSDEGDRELNRCLHHVFLLSHKLEGKQNAYKWAIKNIILNRCWSRYFHTSHADDIRAYGRLYSQVWEQILKDTLPSGEYFIPDDGSLIVPTTQLVAFLISAGQRDLAAGIIEAMIRNLEEDIEHLPLSNPHWYKEPVASSDIAMHLMLLQYRWPDIYAKSLTARQIAGQLQRPSKHNFRSLYLTYLKRQSCESDSLDLIAILLLLDKQVFTIEDLQTNLVHPSLLTEIIFQTIDLTLGLVNPLSTMYSEFDLGKQDAENVVGRNSDSPVGGFKDYILTLEQIHNIPLARQFVLERRRLLQNQEFAYVTPRNFPYTYSYSLEPITHSLFTRSDAATISAFLRTTSYAIDKHDVRIEDGLSWLAEIVPFHPLTINFAPSMTPRGWPQLNNLTEGEPLPGQSELMMYLKELAIAGPEVLLRANGPILQDHFGVCIDLEVIVASVKNLEIRNPETLFEFIRGNRNENGGVSPLAQRSDSALFGKWQKDWVARGYFLPNYVLGDEPYNLRIDDSSAINYLTGEEIIGSWKYWINHWYPIHHPSLGSSVGTFFTVPVNTFESIKQSRDGEFVMVGKMTFIVRQEVVSGLNLGVEYAMISI